MTEQENFDLHQTLTAIYSGILFHNQNFEAGQERDITYHFDCPEYAELREKYDLEKIAGSGSDFERVKRLLFHFAPRLMHNGMYDNHIEINALKLLEYSLDNPEQGINCYNKSKILGECCLALGIYARRVFIMPYSPYDSDNHVVNEIYDRELEKWIMVDLSFGAYFVDENGTPLSLLEMRERYATARFLTAVTEGDDLSDLDALRRSQSYADFYFAKNLFYFRLDAENKFGEGEEYLAVCPEHYSINRSRAANIRYRLQKYPEYYSEERVASDMRKNAANLEIKEELARTNVSVMLKKPC